MICLILRSLRLVLTRLAQLSWEPWSVVVDTNGQDKRKRKQVDDDNDNHHQEAVFDADNHQRVGRRTPARCNHQLRLKPILSFSWFHHSLVSWIKSLQESLWRISIGKRIDRDIAVVVVVGDYNYHDRFGKHSHFISSIKKSSIIRKSKRESNS